MWYMVMIIVAIDGVHMGMGWHPQTYEQCQQSVAELHQNGDFHKQISQYEKQQANAGWLKCVKADSSEEALHSEMNKLRN